MADGRSLTTISETDYEAIESAVMETDRGRWFLKEFARRNRTADTQVLLNAINRLEQAVAGERVAQDVDRLRASLREMATAIARTKTDIASLHSTEQEPGHLFAASEALDGITRTTEQATSDILAAAEHIQESAWTLREDGANPEVCDDLDRRATEIYTACSFQDLTAQRIAKIVQTLRYLEGRINATIAIWDRTEASLAPESGLVQSIDQMADGRAFKPDQTDLTQSDIDEVIVNEDLFGETFAPAPADLQHGPDEPQESLPVPHTAPAEPCLRMEAFAEIDRLPTQEKLRLFT